MSRISLYLIFAFVCLSASCTKKPTTLVLPPAPVQTAQVVQKSIPNYIDTIGHFVAYNSVEIQAQIQGELLSYHFVEGQEVQQGEVLFSIDSKPYEADLDKAVATLRQNEALYAYNKSRADRYSQLVGDDFVSKLDFEQYVSEMKNYDALIHQNLAEIESAEINVGYCTISSPITGITGKRLIDVGNIITDAGTKLLIVNQIDPLYIDFSIPERFFDTVYQHQQDGSLTVEVFVPNTSLKTTACLQMLDNTVNPKTGMISARGVLRNPDKRFWPQQFVRVRLIVNMIENAVMVPEGAVIPSQMGLIAWVVNNNNEVYPAKVTVGENYEGQTQILSGLKPGTQVVTAGQLGLAEGRKVVVRNNLEQLEQ